MNNSQKGDHCKPRKGKLSLDNQRPFQVSLRSPVSSAVHSIPRRHITRHSASEFSAYSQAPHRKTHKQGRCPMRTREKIYTEDQAEADAAPIDTYPQRCVLTKTRGLHLVPSLFAQDTLSDAGTGMATDGVCRTPPIRSSINATLTMTYPSHSCRRSSHTQRHEHASRSIAVYPQASVRSLWMCASGTHHLRFEVAHWYRCESRVLIF